MAGCTRRLRARLHGFALIFFFVSDFVSFAFSAVLLPSRRPDELSVSKVAGREPPPPFPEIIVADTKQEHPSLGPRLPASASLLNLGFGKKWRGWVTKADLVLSELPKFPKSAQGEVVIVMDTDMCFGGCTDIMSRYKRVRDASGGAPVVVGATFVVWPRMDDSLVEATYEALDQRRPSVMRSFGLNPDAIPVDPRETRPNEHTYRYVNAGFVMGPVSKVLDLYQCIKEKGVPSYPGGEFDDQRGLAMCSAARPELVAIDYTGSISLTTHHVPLDTLQLSGAAVKNKVTGLTQCFVHMAGLRNDTTWESFLRQCRSPLSGPSA